MVRRAQLPLQALSLTTLQRWPWHWLNAHAAATVRLQGLAKLGLSYETLHAKYPRLIYCHLTAWGRTGPRVNDPGYDTGAYGAATGIMDQQRPSDDAEMSRWPVGVGDHAASMSVVGGIGLALHHRNTTGLGQLVDVSLLRAGVWANSHSIVAASASDEWARTLQERMPLGGRPLLLQPYATASAQWIHLLGYETPRHLPGVIAALELGDSPLATEERFEIANINAPEK